MNLLRSVSLLALLAAALSASAQELVANGGFETGDFSGWTVSNPDAAYFQVDAQIPRSGTYHSTFGFLNGGTGLLSQTLDTTAGATYTINFALYGVVTNNPADSFGASFDGAPLVAVVGSTSGYVLYSYTAVATSTTSTLSFTFQRGNEQGAYLLDDVSVVADAAPSVPGPLAALPFALIALRRRKRA